MGIIRRILDNPALVVGLVRAVLLFAVTWGATWLTPGRQDSLLMLLAIVLPALSLLLTGVSATATDAKIQQALYSPPPPPPASDPGPDAT